MHLTGIASEDTFTLQTIGQLGLDARGLLLGGIIIGSLGVLDDVTTSQAVAVAEIKSANHTLRWRELYVRSMRIGRTHIAGMVNTLVLAYAGVSLSLLLIMYIAPQPLWVLLNSEMIISEILRAVIGSCSLIAAVPLTSLLAAWWYDGRVPRQWDVKAGG